MAALKPIPDVAPVITTILLAAIPKNRITLSLHIHYTEHVRQR
jgi:hypothetical protein